MPESHICDFQLARPEDASRIAQLINAAYSGEESKAGWTREIHLYEGARTSETEIADLIVTDGTMMLMCLVGAELVGSVLLQRRPEEAYLGMLAVDPHLQGSGHGKRLLEAAEARVQEIWGVPKITMTAITLRPELIAFYQRRGYRLTGEIVPFPTDAPVRFKVKGIELAVLEKLQGACGSDGA